MSERNYMNRVFELAASGDLKTAPNPMVGALVVKEGKIIGEGFHRAYGQPHAEAVALRQAGAAADGSTLYVNLEPCNHQGKTPPCTQAIIEAGVSRVVMAMKDPNPLVNGQGMAALEAAGIEVETGSEEEKARLLNARYLINTRAKRPYFIMKAAQTLDGCIAADDRNSQWITSESSRQQGHELRSKAQAIVIGVGTVLADNPALTLRSGKGQSPIRIVIDPNGRVPGNCQLLTDGLAPTWIITRADIAHKEADKPDTEQTNPKTEYVRARFNDDQLDLHWFSDWLLERGVYVVLLEGGAGVWSAWIEAGLVDEVFLFVAPKLMGGNLHAYRAKHAILDQAKQLRNLQVRSIGEDTLFHGYLTDLINEEY